MKVVLLSDASLCVNGGGIHQTLYNVLSFLPPEKILCVSPSFIIKEVTPSDRYIDRYITYDFEIIKNVRNRFSKYFDPTITWFNNSVNFRIKRFSKIVKAINNFNPDIILCCYNGPTGVIVHNRIVTQVQCKKVIPYFMDDWMGHLKTKWWGGGIQNLIRKILRENHYWMMISHELTELLSENYDTKPTKLFIVHNPVDTSDAPPYYPLEKNSITRFAYAGSLWQMHYDSFLLIAQALQKTAHKNELTLYAPEGFWNWRKTDLELLKVNYGGNIPYSNIHQTLAEKSDITILVSSFKKDYETHSRGSLQTKITDYLKSKRLIVSCGPVYSTNHTFLKKHKCGVCIETTNIDSITKQLDTIMNNIEDNRNYVENGWEVLQQEFGKEKIHNDLKRFLIDFFNE